MEYKKKNKTRTDTTHSSIWRRVSTILRHKAAAKLALLSTLFITILLINVASALAYYQSHNLSEIREIDSDLVMYDGGTDRHIQVPDGGICVDTFLASCTPTAGRVSADVLYDNQLGVIDITGVTAGSGLTGGASSGTATLDVGAGDGINVAADSVAVDVTDILGTGLTESSNNIDVDTSVIQARVSGTCAAGSSIRAISDTGAVTCEADSVNDADASASNELQNLAEVYAQDGTTGNAVQLTATNGDIRFYNDAADEMLFLDESSGNVGIGSTGPVSKLSVGGSGQANTGIYGQGSNAGIIGNASGADMPASNAGVAGVGSSFGIYGKGGSWGVYGTGSTYGVQGFGNTYGVYGADNDDTNRMGYLGGNLYGAYGRYDAADHYGYLGGSAYGVFGHSSDNNAVVGQRGSASISDREAGVAGFSDAGYGVYGEYSGGNYGYLGGASYAVYGVNGGNYGYIGSASYGVYGYGSTAGVQGTDSDTGAIGRIGYDVYGGHFTGQGYFSQNLSVGTLEDDAKLRVGSSDSLAVKADGANGPTRGYLAVQGTVDFDGVTSADWNGQELGVVGISTGGSLADNYGVLGHATEAGVRGEYSGDPSNHYGEIGTSNQGVFGHGTYGVYGQGLSTAESYGVYGEAGSGGTNHYGVYGSSSITGGTNYGVYGRGTGSTDYGVYGEGDYGVYGSGTSAGVQGVSDTRGVQGSVDSTGGAVTVTYGGYFSSYYSSSDSGRKYGIKALAGGASNNADRVAVYGHAYKNAAGDQIGVWGHVDTSTSEEAVPSGADYSGYFTGEEVHIGSGGTVDSATGDGDLYVRDTLEVDGGVDINYGCGTYAALETCISSSTAAPTCDEVPPGGICESDGECGLDPNLDNCGGSTDYYLRLS